MQRFRTDELLLLTDNDINGERSVALRDQISQNSALEFMPDRLPNLIQTDTALCYFFTAFTFAFAILIYCCQQDSL